DCKPPDSRRWILPKFISPFLQLAVCCLRDGQFSLGLVFRAVDALRGICIQEGCLREGCSIHDASQWWTKFRRAVRGPVSKPNIGHQKHWNRVLCWRRKSRLLAVGNPVWAKQTRWHTINYALTPRR